MGRSRPLAWLAAAAVLTAPALAVAQHAVVSADEVLALLKGPKKAVVVDSRTPAEFRQVHIAGAVNIPPERIAAEAARLPKDRAAPLVFYCRGPG
jgi:rhodanese-related sulfurtransferase